MTTKKKKTQPAALLLEILAANIRSIREQRGLSQEALADLCGYHRTYIGSIERCERNVSLSTLSALAVALSTDVPALLTKRERNG